MAMHWTPSLKTMAAAIGDRRCDPPGCAGLPAVSIGPNVEHSQALQSRVILFVVSPVDLYSGRSVRLGIHNPCKTHLEEDYSQ